ncbi:hypothetical protein [Saccharopolyspora endophytica]|nr:hypothetical protein [Saccharopolyspora endophytica]
MSSELVGPVIEGEVIDEDPCPECDDQGGCACCGCTTCGLLGQD